MPLAGRKRGCKTASKSRSVPSKSRKRDSFVLKQTHHSNCMKNDASSQTDHDDRFGPLSYFLLRGSSPVDHRVPCPKRGPGGVEDQENVSCLTTPPKQIHLVQSPARVLNSLSPASALAQLRISTKTVTRTGSSKSCRRLNPSQSINQATDNKRITDYFPVRRSGRKTKKTLLLEKQEDIRQAIISQKDEGLEVMHFGSKGRGVIANRFYQKGDFVVEYAGDLIDVEEARRREKMYAADQNMGCYMYYFSHKGHQYCVDSTKESGRVGRLINHSRMEPNLHTKTFQQEVGMPPHLILIAKKDIHPGDELLYDYGDRSKDSLTYHPWLAS